MTTWAKFDNKLELQDEMKPKEIREEAEKKWPGITEDEYDIMAKIKPGVGLYISVTAYYSYFKRVVQCGDTDEKHTSDNRS